MTSAGPDERRHRGRRLSLLSMAGLLLLSVAGSPPAKAASEGTDTLYAGQQLVALTAHDHLLSRSGEFHFSLSPDSIAVWQFAPLDGPKGPSSTATGTWFRDDPTGRHQSSTDHSVLRLRRNGNLVLMTSRGYLLWSSHTGGTGTHNRVVMRDNGNVVMYTGAGKRVWSTRTTPVYLAAGQRLLSGKQMVSRWGEQQASVKAVLRLTMQTDGQLVLRCNRNVLWHSRTHRRGSYLIMQKDGNLVIRGPHGQPQWSSHTAGAGPYTWFDAMALEILKDTGSLRPIWHVELGYSAPC